MAAFVEVLFRLLARLPLPLLHRLGAGIGWLFSVIPNRHLAVTRRNIALCFPELNAAEQQSLVRRSLMETGKTVLEMPLLWCGDGERVLGLVRETVGVEHVDAALAAGRGAIPVSPHLGAWELVGLYLGHRHPLTALYRPPRQADFDRFIHRSRERLGARLVPTDGAGVRALYRALGQGELAGILPDQEPREGGVFASFFGIPAYTITLVSRLAGRGGAPVILSFAERLPRGAGYRLHFIPIPPAVADPDPETAATALNGAITEAVRDLPAQYQWSYKRFSTRPPGEPPLY